MLGQKMVESNDNGYNENRRRNKEENRISKEHRSEVCGGLSNRTSEELVNSSCDERWDLCRQQSEQKQATQRGISNTSEELVNSNSNGHGKHTTTSKKESIRRTETTIMPRSNKLSDTDKERLERWNGRDLQECTNQQSFRSRDTQVPSRPNEPQYEWEEPRVKPKLGRATNGSSSRVDRLRLLGNGVVPQTAEKAFITLLERLINYD